MREEPKPFDQYVHFKGNRYQVLQIAIHSEKEEKMVVYQAMYGECKVYVRPLDMFLSEVDHEKYPNVKQKYRFAKVGTDEIILPETENLKQDLEVKNAQTKSETSKVQDCKIKEKQPVKTQENVCKEEAEEASIDPMLLEFLDTDSTEERLNILTGLHMRITDDMLNTIAIVMDLQLPEGDTEERYQHVRYALHTKKKYEGTRLR